MLRATVPLVVCLSATAETLSLREALAIASRESPQIVLSRLEASEQQFLAKAVRSQAGLQLEVRFGTTYQTSNLQGIGLAFPGFPSRVGPYRTFDMRPVLTQRLFDPVLWSEIRAARERSREAGFDADAVRETVLYSVVRFYLQALEAHARVKSAEARLRSSQAIREQTVEREKLGAASKLDLERATQQVETERLLVLAAGEDRDVSHTLLAQTLGREQDPAFDPEPLPAPSVPLPPPEDRAATAFTLRPELRALEARLQGADHETKAAERQRLPRVEAFGDFGLSGAGPDRSLSTYTVGAAVSVPLWTSRRIENEIAAARLRRQQVEQQMRKMRTEIAQQVRQAEIEINTAWQSLEAAAKASTAAREAFDLVGLRQGAGLATSLDTQVAQEELARAEQEEIRVRYQFYQGRARLAHAMGDAARVIED